MPTVTATLDVLEAIGEHEIAGCGVATPTTPTPVVIATTEDISVGSVLIKADARLPESAGFDSKRYGPWKALTAADGFAVECTLSAAGWRFFFMVPEIRAAAVSFTPQCTARKALKKVTMEIEAQNINALGIVGITSKHCLGLYYARVVAHTRHAKHSPFLRDLDSHHAPRNVWDFKQFSGGTRRSEAQSKAI